MNHFGYEGVNMKLNNDFISYIDDITLQLQEMYEKDISPNVKVMKSLKNLSDAIEELYSNFDENLFEKESNSAMNILQAISEMSTENNLIKSSKAKNRISEIKYNITSKAESVMDSIKEVPEKIKYKFSDLKDVVIDKIEEVLENWR